uniref:Uncharacterized protein n=1 Tax=Anguilla anguilla TaxID=7936 RepID=A0A0E9VVU2_ANGAN
MPMSAGCR